MRKLPKFVAIGLVAVVSTLMAAEFAEVGGWFPRAAVGADEVDDAVDTDAAADHLCTLLQGAIVMSRSGQSGERLHALLRRAIALAAPSPPKGESS